MGVNVNKDVPWQERLEQKMKTNHEHHMDTIDALWRTPEARLEGYYPEGDVWEGIDRDQAVDDDGKAVYTAYRLSLELGDGYDDHREITIPFSVEDMEEYARTW